MDFDDEDFDFDDLFGEDEPEPDDPPPAAPDFRATVAGARLTVLHWNHALHVSPLHRAVMREREAAGVTIADLRCTGAAPRREVAVTFLARGGGARAERLLARWASLTGHARIWFPGRVQELAPARAGTVSTTCSSCGMQWSESSAEFWAGVRAAGVFPSFCLICGGDLPQWTLSGKRGMSLREVRR